MTVAPLRVGLLGYGYWGKNLARNIAAHPDLELACIADPDEDQLARAKVVAPFAETTTSAEVVTKHAELDVAVVATPLSTHFELTRDALSKGRHVIVTKPLAQTARHAQELSELAAASSRVLLVDHTFVYTGAVQKIRDLVAQDELGELVYCSSMRVNLGTYRRDSSVIWDLLPHDLSILAAIGYTTPVAVAATAGGRMGGTIDQIAHVTLSYDDGFLAQIAVSWLAPLKMRQMLIGGRAKMLVYDDLEASEKVKVYDKGVRLNEETPSSLAPPVEYRLGDMWAPRLAASEALYAEMDHLVECVRNGVDPLTGPLSATTMIKALEAAEASAASDGRFIPLS